MPTVELLAEIERLRAALAQAETGSAEAVVFWQGQVAQAEAALSAEQAGARLLAADAKRYRAALAEANAVLAATRDSEAALAFEMACVKAALEPVAKAARRAVLHPSQTSRDALSRAVRRWLESSRQVPNAADEEA